MSGRIRWFDESPQEGDPRCVCSWCAERIEDDEEDEFGQQGGCVRMWPQDGSNLEARFHDRCLNEAIALGELSLSTPQPQEGAP